jgi:hypothetical protein
VVNEAQDICFVRKGNTAVTSKIFVFAAMVLVLAGVPLAPAAAQGPAGFEVTAHDANVLEIHFHNMPLKAVHADVAQNALALDFANGVDGSAFDRIAQTMPDWVSMAYANYDSGVIRASRPVTFLTRNEADGFSLRMVTRGGPPAMVAAPPGPVALRGPMDGGPPPMRQPMYAGPQAPLPNEFARYNAYGAMRSYDQLELAVNRSDPYWERAYGRAAIQSNSEVGLGTEYHYYHSGDTVIASHAHMKIMLADGVSIIGSVNDTDAAADKVREPNGTFAANTHTNLFDGSLGFGFDMGSDTAATLEALEGNNITGAKFTGYQGNPDSFWQVALAYHQPDMDTPETIASRAFKDELVLGTGQHLGYGIWASLTAHGDNYGVHGDASVGKTAGWAGSLRWSDELGPVLAGIAYDGHGDYLADHVSFNGTAPTPYVPLSLRNRETHAVTGSLSSLAWGDTLWLDLYGGYITDRYASDGAIYGASIRYRPAPGVDLALGARHSNVSLQQGETGAETSAGLTFTLGFDGPSFGSF